MASAAVLKSARSHPKLLSLQHVNDAFLSCSGDAPMTPLGNDTPLFAATVSPRDPAAKLAAATSGPASKAQSSPGFASHRVCIPSSASSDDASDDEDDDSEDVARAGSTSSGKTLKGNTGRWTEAEHKLFLQGLETFPYRAWKKIATLIKTRTVVQIRTHAQKYYQKLEKEEARLKEREAQDRAAIAAEDAIPLWQKVLFANPMDTRFMFARNMKSHAAMQPPHQLPLDFADAAAEAMILDFAEDKAMADYSLDCVDQTLASIDNDDLLQLTEEELEWFSTSNSEQDKASDVKTEAGENFAADLCLDDADDDFVLDPEKFLSSYFAPNEKA
ncbi:Myb domain [Phytophthora cactorum]|nr:Myb domain [Phytophthora cactorum]